MISHKSLLKLEKRAKNVAVSYIKKIQNHEKNDKKRNCLENKKKLNENKNYQKC